MGSCVTMHVLTADPSSTHLVRLLHEFPIKRRIDNEVSIVGYDGTSCEAAILAAARPHTRARCTFLHCHPERRFW